MDAFSKISPPAQEGAEPQLSDEQRLIFMEVIDESLRVSNRSHLFNWLQRSFQCLIPHDVMIVGIRSLDSALFDYEYITSTRYFGDKQFEQSLDETDGLVAQGFEQWSRANLPVFYSSELPTKEYPNYSVIAMDAEVLQAAELKNFVVHGFKDERNKISTLVMFGRLGKQAEAVTAQVVKLLMPHLHCAIVKVTSNKSFIETTAQVSPSKVRQLTAREQEVLTWLQLGKTNWEISSIIDVSPLTVKNHVQNILRKLDVETRHQAVLVAVKLGLISKKQ